MYSPSGGNHDDSLPDVSQFTTPVNTVDDVPAQNDQQSTEMDIISNPILDTLRHEAENEARPQSTSSQLSESFNLNLAENSSMPALQDQMVTTEDVPAEPSSPPKPKSELEIASEALTEDPHNSTAWLKFVELADQTGDLDVIANAYDRLLEAYPNNPSIQIAYINHYLSPPLFPKAESLFARFLRASPFVELWKFYLIYVRRVNPNIHDPVARQTIRKAYEFTINHIGQDKDSGEIWRDYIDFLKNGETKTAWESQQKMDALRSAYHRAVVVPIDNVESLWRELDAFENSMGKITAKKFLADLSPSYMTARTSLRDIRRMNEQLSLAPIKLPSATAPASPEIVLPTPPTWIGDSDRNLVQAWKAYLKWEENNPLDIEDSGTLHTRIGNAYKKAVIRMRFFPEIWYMAHNWTLNTLAKPDEAAALLKQGMGSNESSFLLHFAYAEVQEAQGNFPEVHSAFESLVRNLQTQLQRMETSINAEVEEARASVPSTDIANGELELERDQRGKKVLDRRTKELDAMKAELGVVWIMLMRFARRAEGLKPARGVFARARKDKYCSWGVYEAAALMEYHCTKASDVATKIFELGLKQYGEDVEFVIRYLGFLISINDETNARALFERVISSFTPEAGRPLWERWARYEYHFGDLAATQKLEKRITEVYPNDPPLKRFAQRYMYLNVDAIANRDLGFAFRNKTAPPAPVAVVPPTQPAPSAPAPTPAPVRRAQSPEPPRRRRDPSPPPPSSKRFKQSSPPPRRDFDRDRDYDRDRANNGPRHRPSSPPPRRDRADDRTSNDNTIPQPVLWFLGTLPSASAFDGPVFRTDDLMELLRHGNIPLPSSTSSSGPASAPAGRPRSPPRGRGPPDYSPYTGPGGRGGRRY